MHNFFLLKRKKKKNHSCLPPLVVLLFFLVLAFEASVQDQSPRRHCRMLVQESCKCHILLLLKKHSGNHQTIAVMSDTYRQADGISSLYIISTHLSSSINYFQQNFAVCSSIRTNREVIIDSSIRQHACMDASRHQRCSACGSHCPRASSGALPLNGQVVLKPIYIYTYIHS